MVGSAKGRSITLLTSALPRKSSRTSTQAMTVPADRVGERDERGDGERELERRDGLGLGDRLPEPGRAVLRRRPDERGDRKRDDEREEGGEQAERERRAPPCSARNSSASRPGASTWLARASASARLGGAQTSAIVVSLPPELPFIMRSADKSNKHILGIGGAFELRRITALHLISTMTQRSPPAAQAGLVGLVPARPLRDHAPAERRSARRARVDPDDYEVLAAALARRAAG